MAESSAAPSEPAPSASALRRALRRVRDGSTLDVTEAAVLLAARGADLDELLTHAARVRDAGLVEEGRPGVITYSRNVFIPLTRLCRDRCHYCTFATVPHRLESLFLERDEVVEIARQGAEQGCKEALFTLGDRPEDRWPQAREWLEERGYDSTLDYVRACAIAVLEETGLLPHLNPGVMSWEEATRLKPVAASMGMMLETTSQRLFEKGGPHFGSPDKEPAVRLRALTDAGRVGVPFTTGILIGIGENRTERAESLFAIRSAARAHGHVQEVIVQNFRAKPDTAMANDPDADLDDLAATLAVARLVLGPKIRLQAPPNLVGEEQALMLRAGIDDWGGVSPVTVDHVSPEMPWPAVEDLERVTAAEGFTLAERLTAYPKYVRAGSPWIDTRLHGHVAALATADGLANPDAVVEGRSWQEPDGGFASTGRTDLNTAVDTEGRTADRRSDFGSVYGDWDEVAAELAAQRSRGGGAGRTAGGGPRLDADARAGLDLAASDPAALLDPANEAAAMAVLTADGPALGELVRLADDVRRDVNGEDVTYVVNRNINFSNVCYVGCRFCAFAQRERDADAFRLSLDDVAARAAEAARDGATEVCVQGGIDPQLPVSFYADLVRAVHEAVPGMHVHAFSPMEIVSAAAKAGVSIRDWLAELKEAGLGSIPGTAAEILDDEVRWVLTKGKLPASQWIEVVSTAHELGIPSSSTMMYGHVDEPRHWLGHLRTLASIQDRSLAAGAAAFTEFVPLPFVHHNAPIYLAGIARPGPTERDNRAVHAFARLALHGRIDHVQVSWVKLGDELAGDVLGGGADDMGGTLMEETISRMAGSENGSERSVEELTAIAHAAGRPVRQRTTTYRGEPSVLTPSRPPTLPLTPA